MNRALQLARRAMYTTDPNPRVGCVLVDDERTIVGEGWHQRAGAAHAEVHALQQAGERAKGATAYVTLEPCDHTGRTGPCSQALIDAGVRRVVAAMQDPNPKVSGRGLQRMQQAGLLVESGLYQSQAEQLNPGFMMRMRHGRPYVRCKLAMSLDAKTAMASGESQWITGEAARLDVHRLRARSSALLAGIGTVLTDDPSYTVRLAEQEGEWMQPLRVILDPHLQTPSDAKLLKTPGPVSLLTLNGASKRVAALKQAGAAVVDMPGTGSEIKLSAVMAYLCDQEMNEVLLETGATLSGSMLQAGFVDELVIYMAPCLLGDGARSMFNLPGLTRMKERVSLRIDDIRSVGRDWRIVAKPEKNTSVLSDE